MYIETNQWKLQQFLSTHFHFLQKLWKKVILPQNDIFDKPQMLCSKVYHDNNSFISKEFGNLYVLLFLFLPKIGPPPPQKKRE